MRFERKYYLDELIARKHNGMTTGEYQKYQHQLMEEEHLQSLKELESDLKKLKEK